MAWSEPLPNPSGRRAEQRYRAGWRDSAGRVRRKSGFTSAAAAERYAGQQETDARKGGVSIDGRAPTWAEWRPRWESLRVVEPGTVERDRSAVEAYLAPKWGRRRVTAITRDDVQAWVIELGATTSDRTGRALAPGSVARHFHLFKGSMTSAVHAGILGRNPCEGVKLPTSPPGHERFLTPSEVDRIVDLLPDPYRAAVLTLAYTGLRFGELAGLHWRRVDLDAGTLDVVETFDLKTRAIKGYPKGKARRTVPLAGRVVDELRARRESAPPDGLGCAVPHRAGVCRSSLVFTLPSGWQPLDGGNFSAREWATALGRADAVGQAEGLAPIGHVRIHDLRHTCASWLVQRGVKLQEVQSILGHASITTTERYAHLAPDEHDRARAALDLVDA